MRIIITTLILFAGLTCTAQNSDSTWNADFGYKGIPTGIVHQKWSDTTLYFTAKYQEFIDTANIHQEILKLQVNWDSVQYYKPQIYNNMISKFFDSAERTFLIQMSKEAAKERHFGYKRYFK